MWRWAFAALLLATPAQAQVAWDSTAAFKLAVLYDSTTVSQACSYGTWEKEVLIIDSVAVADKCSTGLITFIRGDFKETALWMKAQAVLLSTDYQMVGFVHATEEVDLIDGTRRRVPKVLTALKQP